MTTYLGKSCSFGLSFYFTIFYVTPSLSFTYFALRGLCSSLNNYLSKRFFSTYNRLGCAICILVYGFMSLCSIYHLYIFTILFVDGFFFVSRIVMFIFTAFVAYPRETYGYFMLIVLSTYFILEGLFRFGIIYHQILKYAVKFSKQDLEDNEYKTHFSEFIHTNETVVVGSSKELFEYLVDHIRPRRVMFFTHPSNLYSLLLF